MVLDIGANPDCEPLHLFQFGIMGSIYAEKVRGVNNPKVGLVSNGEEEGKGNHLVKEATPLFKNSKLNYYGNVEGKEVIGGKVDVAVTDGFVGNVMLKTSEAVAKLIVDKIKEAIKGGGPLAMLGGLLVKPALGKIKKLLDPSDQGAAVLLGVNGLVFIGHGRSDALAIQNAVRVAKNAVEANVLAAIKSAIEVSLKSNLNTKKHLDSKGIYENHQERKAHQAQCEDRTIFLPGWSCLSSSAPWCTCSSSCALPIPSPRRTLLSSGGYCSSGSLFRR